MVQITSAVEESIQIFWDDTSYCVAEHTIGCNEEGKIPQRLPARYGIVTSNTSQWTNSMIEEYQGESWTDLLEGVLHHMTQRISDKRQKYSD